MDGNQISASSEAVENNTVQQSQEGGTTKLWDNEPVTPIVMLRIVHVSDCNDNTALGNLGGLPAACA